ncbi:MAG: TrbI/VirB10 family protein [Bryobacterales bacterium]|nr:TrbI/VirB10 family protein [Bryobacterales bacterium]
MNPEPPSPVRLSKRAGIVALVVVFLVVAQIGYGIYSRGQAQNQVGFQPDETRGMTAATDAGKLVAAQVPNRPTLVAAAPAEEVAAAEPERLTVPRSPAHYTPSAAPPTTNVAQPREPSLAERRMMAAYERELEAMNAATTARDGFRAAASSGAGVPSLPTAAGDIEQMTSLLRAMQGPSGQIKATAALPNVSIGTGGNSGEGLETQNMQDRKEAFLARSRRTERNNYLDSTRAAPMSRYELKAGWDIPAILEQALNSDLPGEIKALVRENVYDSATGRFLLIPQGSRLVGTYDFHVSYGQDGLQVVWARLIFPDASSIDLAGMSGQDAKGYTGLRHDVDNHYKRLLGFGLLTSLFSASFQLSQTRRGGLLGYPSAGEIAGSAVGREMSQLGTDVTRRNLNVQPTIKVPIGYRFNVRVNRDIVFDGPFRPF